MSDKSKTPAPPVEDAVSTTRAAHAKSPARSVGIVVRRGALRRFDRLQQAVGELPVQLTWDRRTNNRTGDRTGQRERRGAPPATWDLADFVVVDPNSLAESPATGETAAAPKDVAPGRPASKPRIGRRVG